MEDQIRKYRVSRLTASVAVTLFTIAGVGAAPGPMTEPPSNSPPPFVSGHVVAANETDPAAVSESVPADQNATTPPAPARQIPQEANSPVAPPQQSPKTCPNCGVIDSIRTVQEKAPTSGVVGTIAGGVLGGVLGHQIGGGRGNTAATILGAAGGAYAGNQVEKNINKPVMRYDVKVAMDNGSYKTISLHSKPDFVAGEKVKVIKGKIVRY
jgi:outer membrane lipoprotein SlyB